MQHPRQIKTEMTSFFKDDIWKIQQTGLSPLKLFGLKFVRILVLAVKGFIDDKLPLRASALTLYSLLSLVPFLAMIFGIAKGFGVQNTLQNRLMEVSAGQEVVMEQLMEYAQRLLDSTKGGVIAGIGIAVLFYTVVKLLGNVEMSFNHIWGIKTSRSLGRKFSDYLSILLIAPLLLSIAGGATVFIKTQIALIIEKISLLGFFAPFIFFTLKFLPFGVMWFLFTLVYVLIPNTKVNISAGLVAGVFAGTAVQLAQWAYITFQIGTAKYNAIYGSFAALPLFLVWLQLTWIIVLIGAEVSFAYQNAELFEFEPHEAVASDSLKKRIALHITHHVVKRFEKGEPPETAADIAQSLQTPVRLVRNLLHELVESGVLSVVQVDQDKDPAFQPAYDIHQMTLQSVIDAMDHRGDNKIPFQTLPEFDMLSDALTALNARVKAAPENKLIKDIQ